MAEDRGGPPRINPFQVAVTVVVAAAVLIGYLVATHPASPAPPDAVRPGDQLTVDYVAFFEDGRVFDTSLREVAENDAAYPKALTFQARDDYRPITFTVAGPEPEVIPGFERAMLEPTPLRVGETREFVVEPDQGYGPADPDLIETRPLTEELEQQETLRTTAYADLFGQSPAVGLTVLHPVWQWPVTVLEMSGHFVTVLHTPEVGFTLQPHGAWPARVVQVDSGAHEGRGLIVVQHLLDARHVHNVEAEDERGTFRVVSVDREAGTYTVDYNPEVVGQNLHFRVTLRSITRR